ncbi:MAG: HlyD family efflux transporter periplasmic adaptor subunit [Alphaproteobacteria bacterium]|nr:HlyD family efflux transporter periplasmic adaptor subunit [Alphaproteobacteria bacterium]
MTAQEKRKTRKLLMILGPVIVMLVSGVFYLYSGRYIETDNAYVKANKISVTAQVAGTIIDAPVKDNQFVKKGEVLFRIDPRSFEIKVEKAKASLGDVRTQIEDLKAQARQKQAELKEAQQDADYAKIEFDRQQGLSAKDAVSRAKLDEATHNLDVTRTKVGQLQQELGSIVAQLDGDIDIAPEDHPLYKVAQSELDAAQLDLDRATVRAPVDGLAGATPHTGDYANAGVPVMSMVASADTWIEANYKETQLTDVKPGQKVDIAVDTYPGHEWTGVVESISPATGSEFSILPAQNSTGNWVKVVQRIAVRIRPEVKPGDPQLRAGMSTEVTIDTGSFPHLHPFAENVVTPAVASTGAGE